MKVIDADKLREWLVSQRDVWITQAKHIQYDHGRSAAYNSALDYLDDHEYNEQLTITFHELKYGLDWFCAGSQSGIIGWSTESKQEAIDQYHRRRKEKADETNANTNTRI